VPFLAVSREDVERNFAKYGLLDDRVVFLQGWFKDTLPSAPIGKIALLRLDGDMYESTMDALQNLYPKLSPGGYCIIDDFFGPCRLAVGSTADMASRRK
jgi:predicted O-methyltransferase YrrM